MILVNCQAHDETLSISAVLPPTERIASVISNLQAVQRSAYHPLQTFCFFIKLSIWTTTLRDPHSHSYLVGDLTRFSNPRHPLAHLLFSWYSHSPVHHQTSNLRSCGSKFSLVVLDGLDPGGFKPPSKPRCSHISNVITPVTRRRSPTMSESESG